MREDVRDWDMDLVKTIFHEHGADEVLKIRIPSRPTDDSLAWHFEKSGLFSVRSAYKLALRDVIQQQGVASTSSLMDGGRRAWKQLWSTPVPHKLKIFAWKLATEGLATMQNRMRTNLESDSTCRLCGRGEEDGYHAVIGGGSWIPGYSQEYPTIF